eukprot:PITA_33714
MMGYEFGIIYKKWKQNVVADALSKKDEDVEALLCAISIIQPDWINESREEWKNDEEVWALTRKLQQDSSTSDTYSWQNDSLWYKDRIYLCKNSQLKQKIFMELNTSPLGGHSGFLKTYHRVKKEFFWEGLKSDIQKFVAECLVCQQNKVETIKTLGLLQLYPFQANIGRRFQWILSQLAHSSSYHPQSDGQTEIVNKCLEGYPRCFVSDKQTQWVKWLPLAEWWYNTSFHTTTKMTPLMALYGYHPPSITSYLRENSKVQAVEHHIEHQEQVLQLLKDHLVLAQNRMKQQADQHRSERSFDVGDWVFLRIQPYKKMSLKQAKKDNKLSPKYYGPYKVLQKIGTMAYKLELPATSRLHPVFHVSCLKKVIGDKLPVQTIFPELDEEGKIILEPEEVTETRTRQLRNRSISEYLIKWKNLSTEDSTWEDGNFIHKHPELLKVEDNTFFKGEGHVGSP